MIHACLGLGLLLAVLAVGSARGADSPSERPSKPNILFIIIDDLGWTDGGIFGSDLYETPNIDRLRREGLYFSQAYMAAPICTPSRISVMFGRYPARYGINEVPGAMEARKAEHRMTRLIEPECPKFVPYEEVSMADALKDDGYRTIAIGKWHISDEREATDAVPHGFDEQICRVDWEPEGDEKQVRWLTDQTIAYLKEHQDDEKPFFIYLGHYAIHHDYHAPADLVEKYRKKVKPGLRHFNPLYAANLEFLDQNIGRLMQALDDLKLKNDTVVFFTSDNGGRTGNVHFQKATSNEPLRNGKHSLYEGGLRVPLLVRWPGVVKPDTTCNVPVMSMDFLPTLQQIAGGPPLAETDGTSIVPLLEGKSDALKRSSDAFYWYYPYYILKEQYGPFTYSLPAHPIAAVRSGNYKLIEHFEYPELAELYDLEADPGEVTNLADAMPEKVLALRKKIDHWLDHGVQAERPKPNPSFDPKYEGSRMPDPASP